MTDPASAEDDDYCTCEPAGVELYNGWTLVAPPGTSKAATEYAARRLYDDDYLPSPEDAEAAAEDEARKAARDAIGPMHGPPTKHQHMLNELLIETLNRTMRSTSPLMDFMFQDPPKAQKFGTVVYDTVNPSDPATSWVKRMMLDDPPPRGSLERAQYEGNWTVEQGPDDEIQQWGYVAVVGDDIARALRWDLADLLNEDTQDLIRGWAAHPPARPGWTGSVTGPPRPIPLKPTPWQTLPKGIHDGNRTVIIEPGADSNPDARRLELRHGEWVDVGPWFPNGLRPAYRGKPAPIPWDSPLADPVEDMRRAVEDDQ